MSITLAQGLHGNKQKQVLSPPPSLRRLKSRDEDDFWLRAFLPFWKINKFVCTFQEGRRRDVDQGPCRGGEGVYTKRV